MDLDELDYSLPRELIAQTPLLRRDSSRLMVVAENILHDQFSNIASYLEDGDVLVMNKSRVLKAKITGSKETGGKVELLVVTRNDRMAECIVKGRKIREGSRLDIGRFSCRVEEKSGKYYRLRFDTSVDEVIDSYGELPLPYYIKKPVVQPERYQTVYSKDEGSVAAPTAGLHFTDKLLEKLKGNGVEIAYVTMHIGPSTFMPIESLQPDRSHPEPYQIDDANAEIINKGIDSGTLMAVGTSTVKTLESSAKNGRIASGKGHSDLLISPGYVFQLPYKALITNFHLPRSTLLLLVSALFGRERILNAYKEAITNRYRFYSFGDAMFIKEVLCSG